MARLLCFGLLALLASPIIGILYVLFLKAPPPLPDVDVKTWWGPEELRAKQDTSIQPFRVQFTNQMITELKQRLKNHRKWTPPLENIGFQYGFNCKQLDSWVSYWAEKYNFTEREKFFNQFPQFKTNIQGLDIHFIRVKPEVPAGVEVVPMLFLHGWPGSVREFYEALPLLTAVSKNRNFAIEAIVPSLPGYGFSDATVRPGLGVDQVAVVMRNLMQRLGFKKFYVQGGDWGSIIGSDMATLFPNEILGFHTNLGLVISTRANLMSLIGSVFPSLVVESHLAERMYPLSKTLSFLLEEAGYFHLQATKPDTVGVGVSDSPAGLLAYILEKFSTGTNPEYKTRLDGGLAQHWSKDQLLDNLMCYWATNSFTTSARLYSESFNTRYLGLQLGDSQLDAVDYRGMFQVPAGVEVVPMLFLHGWPGSVREFYEALPLLTAVSKNRNFAIEAIVPSLPGYGFSDATVRPGLGVDQVAVVMRNLMQRLGFKKFYVQGGDWGSIIGSDMATLFPNEILGFHTNLGLVISTRANLMSLIGSVFPSLVVESHLAERMYPLSKTLSFLLEEAGYFHLQATKPDTVGVGVSDSPAGLLAYILEKFSTGTNPEYKTRLDGGLAQHWSKDQLLDNLMCYWATNSFTTSARLYSESFNTRYLGLQLGDIPTPVPTWILQAKNEVVFLSKKILRFKYTNLIQTNPIGDGGHFLAFELPRLFSEDVLKAVEAFRKFRSQKTEL